MDSLREWWVTFEEALLSALAGLGASLPAIGAAIGIVLVGWLVARMLRAIIVRSGGALNRTIERFGRPMTPARARLSNRLVSLVAKFLFWVVILVFVTIAARVAGLDTFSVWLGRLIDYLPTLFAGLLIAFVGFLLSALVRDAVTTTLVSIGSDDSEVAGIAAQAAVFLTAFVIGLDQIGIDVTFLIILSAVLLGGALLGIALAFGFGARDYVGNLIAAHQLRGILETGDRANVGGVEGRILEITSTSVVLIGDKGRILVPASSFQKQIASIVPGDQDE